jgi:glutathione peroxidase
MEKTIYDFSAKTIKKTEKPLSDYKGKVLLIVNVASRCGFTPQYKGLEQLYEKYRDRDFEILGFPCNQFLNQEPGTNEEIASFCELNFGVKFPLFDKIEVNGKNSHPLYSFLKDSLPGEKGKDIEWNFTKFLIDRSGKPVKRYASKIKPEDIDTDVAGLL